MRNRSPVTGELSALAGWQIAALQEMMCNTVVYTQRVLEEVTFPTPDGQRWRRRLQLRLPEWDGFAKGQTPPDGDLRFVVPLGVFLRARLPDLAVSDGKGQVCPLVTRNQHGFPIL